LTHLDAISANAILQQRLAKYLVLQCVRNSALEDLHAGIAPSSATGDYGDVTVTSPFGAIPWPRLSRFNDQEMKQLMIDVVDRTYQFLHTIFDEPPAGRSSVGSPNTIPFQNGTHPDTLKQSDLRR
jgi:hypothetical protein